MRKLLTVVFLITNTAVLAHHSPAVFYHMEQHVTMTGTVTEFRMGNPHIRVYFEVEQDNGEIQQWLAEGGSRTVLLRHGWKGDEVKPGDVVTIYGNPSREDKNIVHMINITLANGEEKFAEDLNPDTTQRLLEERRNRN